ncbi:MAG: hypothetical protein ACE5G1_16570 [bacterium]
MKKLELTLFLLVFCYVEGTAQPRFNYEVGGGYIAVTKNGTLLSNWDDGWMLGAGISYKLTSSVAIVTSTSFQRYRYQGGFLNLNFPDEGYRKINGGSTNRFELSLGARLISNKNTVKFYITLRGGFLLTEIGQIKITSWNDNEPDKKFVSVRDGTGRMISESSLALGFGLIIPVGSDLNLIFENKFVNSFKTESVFIPFTLSIQF